MIVVEDKWRRFNGPTRCGVRGDIIRGHRQSRQWSGLCSLMRRSSLLLMVMIVVVLVARKVRLNDELRQ